MSLRKPIKGRFLVTSSSLWVNFFSIAFHATHLLRFKLLLMLYLKASFYMICLPLIAFVIVFGNLWERCRSRFAWQATGSADFQKSTAVSHSVKQDSSSCSNRSIVSLVVGAVNRKQVVHFLQDKLGCTVKTEVSYGIDMFPWNRGGEPMVFEELIPKYLTCFASHQEEIDDGEDEIEVLKITRHSPVQQVTSLFLVAAKSADPMFLDRVLCAFDPTLVIRHRETESEDLSKYPPVSQQLMNQLLAFCDSSQIILQFRQKCNQMIHCYAKEKVASAVASLIREAVILTESVPTTLSVLISQVTRRLVCCKNYPFLLFRKIRSSQVNGRNLSLAFSDCLPAELIKRIQETCPGLTADHIALSCISSALRSYAQEMTGNIPRDTQVFLHSGQNVDGLEGSLILLPIESAQDLIGTTARIRQRFADSMAERDTNRRKKQLMMRTLPTFLYDWMKDMSTSGHQIVVKTCCVEGDEQSFIRSIYYWPSMTPDTLLSLIVVHRKDGVAIGVCCKKDAFQAPTLLAEFLTKSVTNLCIAFSIQWDRRSPPSTPNR